MKTERNATKLRRKTCRSGSASSYCTLTSFYNHLLTFSGPFLVLDVFSTMDSCH